MVAVQTPSVSGRRARKAYTTYLSDLPNRRIRFVVGFMVSWVVGTDDSAWIALVFLAAGITALIIGVEVEERWKRIQRRRAALLAGET